LLHWWDSWHYFVNNTASPIHVYKFIIPEVWKAFNVGINAWYITAVLYSDEVRTRWICRFFWRTFTYTLRCIRCGQPVTLAGSFGETLLHAPTPVLFHWNMIESHEEQNHRQMMLMPLLSTSYDNYKQLVKSFQEGSSEEPIRDLATWIFSADQINLYNIQYILIFFNYNILLSRKLYSSMNSQRVTQMLNDFFFKNFSIIFFLPVRYNFYLTIPFSFV
jgi:hypothetical protein